MVPRRLAGLCIAAVLLHGQAMTPKAKPSDYPAHAESGKFTLGAEYLVHSIPLSGGGLFTNDYLVVEAAFYGPALTKLKMSSEQFTLRINGKNLLYPQTPGLVAATLEYPEWQQHPRVVGTAGNGNGDIIVGQPPPVARYPGDPNAQTIPFPRPPEQEDRSGIPPEIPMRIEERLQRASVPEGERVLPVSGLLFFAFHGKTKSIHSLELLYDGPAGKVALKLL